MLFGELVSKHRKARGLSEAELAAAVGADVAMVRSWESSAAVPEDADVIRRLSESLDIELGLAAAAARSTADQITAEKVRSADERARARWSGTTSETSEPDPPADGAAEQSTSSSPSAASSADRTAAPETADVSARSSRAPSIDDPGALALAAQPTEQIEAVKAAPRPQAQPPRSAPPQSAAEPEPRTYLEDPRVMTTYWVRWILTAAGLLALLVALIWGLGQLFDIIGEIIEQITEEAADDPPSPGSSG